MNKPVIPASFENDIKATLEKQYPLLPSNTEDDFRTKVPDLPSYVAHRDGIDPIGSLSAQGVIQKFEATAHEVEAMGDELRAVAKRCEEMLKEVADALSVVQETAAEIRETGKLIFLKIEDASLMAGEVRTTCIAMKEKLIGDAT